MRWFMGLLIAAGALAGVWGGLMSSWQMETGVSPFEIIHADGSVQHAEIGPASYWPEWAIQPDGVTLQVRATFDESPGQLGTG